MVVKFLSAKTAKILSNNTARKILKALTKKKSTSQIAKELDLPLTTVDYNISQLEKAGLIKSGYYMWSKRGNKMKLYEPAGEILVYAPEPKPGLLDAMNKLIIPVVLAFAGAFGYVVQKFFYRGATNTLVTQEVFTEEVLRKGATEAAAPVADAATTTAAQGTPVVAEAISENITNTTVYITENTAVMTEPQLWFWFMIVAGVVMLLIYLMKSK